MNALLYVADTHNLKFHQTMIILRIFFCLLSADKASGGREADHALPARIEVMNKGTR